MLVSPGLPWCIQLPNSSNEARHFFSAFVCSAGSTANTRGICELLTSYLRCIWPNMMPETVARPSVALCLLYQQVVNIIFSKPSRIVYTHTYIAHSAEWMKLATSSIYMHICWGLQCVDSRSLARWWVRQTLTCPHWSPENTLRHPTASFGWA